ncbi:unnamed protein product [Meganyctiphanes norvegica]|uniref:Uncharacterized protein n=1 Tax=Meganyctiphanes norvegica TaxID=48144 RepID=A0AAV2R7B5_MEGNR
MKMTGCQSYFSVHVEATLRNQFLIYLDGDAHLAGVVCQQVYSINAQPYIYPQVEMGAYIGSFIDMFDRCLSIGGDGYLAYVVLYNVLSAKDQHLSIHRWVWPVGVLQVWCYR